MHRWAHRLRELASLFALYDFFAVYTSPVQASQSSLLKMTSEQSGAAQRGCVQNGIKLFLCGDVMTGRGVDQILPHPSKPNLYEGYIRDARDYVRLAERENGAIEKPVDYPYIWGDALKVLEEQKPHARIINLETSVTTSESHLVHKGIHYRMHPENVPAIASASIDCCVLANNHVLDWGVKGLEETLDVLQRTGLRTVGAGRSDREAAAPAVIDVATGKQGQEQSTRVLVFAYGMDSSGVPSNWAAMPNSPGVNFLSDLSEGRAEEISRRVADHRRPGDVVVVSIHWGPNWGYQVPRDMRRFAHQLIDAGAADIIHGHSSHHPMGIEVYRDKPILYGCGDFLNDYEGISGHDEYRSEITLMYFPVVNRTDGKLLELTAMPMEIRNIRLNYASNEDADWLHDMLTRECGKFGVKVARNAASNALSFHW